jgi:undecaprenyl-diphosphatase
VTPRPLSVVTGLSVVLVLLVLVLLFLVLVRSDAATTLIDAAVRFDTSLLALLNPFARRSLELAKWMRGVSENGVLQTGVIVALLWSVWFTSETAPGQRRHETVLSSLVAVYTTAVLALILRAALPFRLRPLQDSASALYLPDYAALWAGVSSFPSGHAAVSFALATGLGSISVTLGLVGVLYALIVNSLPRLYLGLHYPTDILAGAALGILTVSLINKISLRRSLMQPVVAWSGRHPALFYGLFFLSSLEVAAEFMTVRMLLRLVRTLHSMRIVTP